MFTVLKPLLVVVDGFSALEELLDLAELQARLARGKTRPDRAAVKTEIAAICKARWVSEVVTTTLTGNDPTDLRLTWRTNAADGDGWRTGCSANGSCSPTVMTGPSMT